ncbi:MAG: hypothetical protein R6W92_11210 [Desulfocurvibacter africanus]
MLLALALSFTYSYVNQRLDARKAAVISEADAIGTAYLRADFAPEPLCSRLRSLLAEYARSRLVTSQIAATREKLPQSVAASLAIQAQFWPVVSEVMKQSAAGPKEALLAQAVNDVIDMHTVRLAAGYDRLPHIILYMLLVIAGLAMLVTGYVSGLSNTWNRWITMSFALVLAGIMYVIVDMDTSHSGFVQVSQQPIKELIMSMEGTSSSPPPTQ